MAAKVAAISFHVPDDVLTNEQLAAENPDWDLVRAERKIGIKSRHIADQSECSSDLAMKAAERLLSAVNIERDSIDVLVFCTQSPDHYLPASACNLQQRLGLSTSCAAFDINQGCSGYIYGLYLAKGLIESDLARRVLLLTGETYSKFIHPRDRTNRLLFGDAGSATLVTSDGEGAEIQEIVVGTDGCGFHNLIVPAGGMRTQRTEDTATAREDSNGSLRSLDNLYMNGQEIFMFSLNRVPAVVNEVLARAHLTIEQVDWYVFHQANAFMNEALRVKLEIPKSKYSTCIEEYGNTVSNSIPIAVCKTGSTYKPGDRVMLVGFGVGYSWGACLLNWGQVRLV